MKYWNSTLKNMTEYIPGEQPEDLDEFIKLNTNENPFPPSEQVLESIRKAANRSLKRYPDASSKEVREIFAADNGLSPDNVFVANGSDEIFTLIFRGFIEPGGLAAFPYPSYSLYDTLAEANGISFKKIDLNSDFTFNMAAFLKKKYNLVIIASPNNPTGTWCELSEIKKFLGKFTGLLVVDEAYIDFYGESAVSLVKEFDNLIVTRSFSKSYSLAGLRIGIAIACKEIIDGFLKIKDSYNVDSLALAGAKAALLDKKGFDYNKRMTVSNKEYLEERLEGYDFTIIPSRANFLFVKHATVSSEDIYTKLKEKKVLVRYFKGPVQSDYVRISVGTMQEIKVLCKELEAIVEAG
ncbi:MAG: histidinol-phosphate transaminase [bacterium]|nr:histidinol-phosphate transaminase [bacterium]